jgi:hypothetical protein
LEAAIQGKNIIFVLWVFSIIGTKFIKIKKLQFNAFVKIEKIGEKAFNRNKKKKYLRLTHHQKMYNNKILLKTSNQSKKRV